MLTGRSNAQAGGTALAFAIEGWRHASRLGSPGGSSDASLACVVRSSTDREYLTFQAAPNAFRLKRGIRSSVDSATLPKGEKHRCLYSPNLSRIRPRARSAL